MHSASSFFLLALALYSTPVSSSDVGDTEMATGRFPAAFSESGSFGGGGAMIFAGEDGADLLLLALALRRACRATSVSVSGDGSGGNVGASGSVVTGSVITPASEGGKVSRGSGISWPVPRPRPPLPPRPRPPRGDIGPPRGGAAVVAGEGGGAGRAFGERSERAAFGDQLGGGSGTSIAAGGSSFATIAFLSCSFVETPTASPSSAREASTRRYLS